MEQLATQNAGRYAVFGNPIKHSRSPQIHTAFAEQTGQQLSYRTQLVELGGFVAAAQAFFAGGGNGLNITVPFKLDACAFAHELSGRARRAGAANTLAAQGDGSIYGDNTDGVGLVRDIEQNLAWEITGKRVLLLGAGGAVRGILEPLLKRHPALVVIVNRSVDKAQQLAREFADLGEVRACSYDALVGNRYDLLINGTSAGLQGELPPLPGDILSDGCSCYDMTYGSAPTPFMRWAASEAAWAVADGLGMLVEQAAESFCIWRGVRPATRPVIDMLRASLSGH
ncbi:MAG: shikimate dehydrogenase [Verrucomicrobiaceae bacterium]|nr:shikimate dehydrogenase [Verrucomicrobiaceae bacterium]